MQEERETVIACMIERQGRGERDIKEREGRKGILKGEIERRRQGWRVQGSDSREEAAKTTVREMSKFRHQV